MLIGGFLHQLLQLPKAHLKAIVTVDVYWLLLVIDSIFSLHSPFHLPYIVVIQEFELVAAYSLSSLFQTMQGSELIA